MSLSINFGRRWENCKLFLLNPTGPTTGTVSVGGWENQVFTCNAPLGESAKATRFVNVSASEKITVKCHARVTSGTQGSIGIDYPTAGNLHVVTKVTSTEWQVYECTMIIPQSATSDALCQIQIGSYGSDAGMVEFTNPSVVKESVTLGAAQVLAMGQIYFDASDSNIPKVNPGFCNHGIYALSYDVASKSLSITIPQTQRDDPEGAIDTTLSLAMPTRPIFFGNVAFDNGGAGLAVQFSEYTYSTGVLKGKFYNSSGVLIDIATVLGSGNIYINFKAEVN